MADVQDIPPGDYDVVLGETFAKNADNTAFHTLRFDFKPKSLNTGGETYIAFGENNDVQVAVPADSGDSLTIYKGSQKAVKADKECLLLFDHRTGELRLEKLSSNIGLKKIRGQEADSSGLRARVQHLRELAAREKAAKSQDVTKDDGSSSSSDDSDSSSSDSDDSDDEKGEHKRASNDSESPDVDDDDDEYQDVIEQHLRSEPVTTVPSPLTVENKPSGNRGASACTTSQKKLLHEDLQLSDSSDDD